MKLRQILLYFASCIILAVSQFPGGGLIAIASLFQLLLVAQGRELSKQNQFGMLKLVLTSVPLLIFWGGAHSFALLYLRQGAYVMAAMALSLSFLLCLMIYFQLVFSLNHIEASNYNIMQTLFTNSRNLKEKTSSFLKLGSLFFILTFVPYLAVEWKMVFAVTVICLFPYRQQLKTAVSNF